MSSSASSLSEIGVTLTIPGSLHAVSKSATIVLITKKIDEALKRSNSLGRVAGMLSMTLKSIQVPARTIRTTAITPGQCGPIVICSSPSGDSSHTYDFPKRFGLAQREDIKLRVSVGCKAPTQVRQSFQDYGCRRAFEYIMKCLL